MKSNTFQTQGLQELSPSECRQINGGVAWWVVTLAGTALYNVVNHWDHFKQGLSGEPEQPEK